MDSWIDIKVMQSEVIMRQEMKHADDLRTEASHEEGRLQRSRESFRQVKEGLLKRASGQAAPQAEFEQFTKEVGQLRSSKEVLGEQLKRLGALNQKRSEVAMILKGQASRLTRLTELGRERATLVRRKQEASDFEGQMEGLLAAGVLKKHRSATPELKAKSEVDFKDISTDKADRRSLEHERLVEDSSAPASTASSDNVSQVLPDPASEDRSGLAGISADARGFSGNGFSEQNAASEGSTQNAWEREASQQPEERFNPGDYAERMEAVQGWENAVGSGVEFTWVKDDGAKVGVALRADQEERVKILIQPEMEGDRQRLFLEKKEMAEALSGAGVSVKELSIGGFKRGSK